MGLAVVGLASLALLLLRRHAAALFTNDPAVLEACGGLMLPLAALLTSEPRCSVAGCHAAAGGEEGSRCWRHRHTVRLCLLKATPPCPRLLKAQPTASSPRRAACCTARGGSRRGRP